MSKYKKILFVFGTRPEAIKMAPLILHLQKDSYFEVGICTTGQHKEMLQQVMDFFELSSNYDLALMQINQNLFSITANAVTALQDVLIKYNPNLVVVQGDTTTAFVGALAAFYKQIPVAHLEAGLRSNNIYAPFPEEANRKMIASIATVHLAPTQNAVNNLLKENITHNIYHVGNTVIDALLWGVQKVRENTQIASTFAFLDSTKKIILVTGHRRESFGQPFENICNAIKTIATQFENNVQIVYPVHLNPNVQQVVNSILAGLNNVHLISPLSYPSLIWLMDKSYIVLTDSGGIQEEAPTLGKPVLVMRDVTERTEGIEAGTAKLVGTNYNTIVEQTIKLLTDNNFYNSMANAVNPYGDGTTCEQIKQVLKKL